MDFDKKKAIVQSYQKQTSDLEELKKVVREYNIEPEEIEAIVEAQSFNEDVPQKQEETAAKEKILSLIESMDKGEGCDYLELSESADLSEDVLDHAIEELLEEGTCFEPKPGK